MSTSKLIMSCLEKYTKSKKLKKTRKKSLIFIQLSVLLGSRMAVYASYGGLLMRLEGDAALLKVIPYDSRIYVLISKI